MRMLERVVPELAEKGIYALENLSTSMPNVLLMHGINSDLHEDASPLKRGFFDRLVAELHALGLGTLRFDFRGHGLSQPVPDGVSIRSELGDLEIVSTWASEAGFAVRGYVGCSFGACATGVFLASQAFDGDLALVLANPVVDPFATFFDPGTPWSRQTVGIRGLAEIQSGKTVMLDGEFPLSPDFLESIVSLNVPAALRSLSMPTLIVHGTNDTYVDVRGSQDLAVDMHGAQFVGVESEHGFGDPTIRQEVAEMAARFLREQLL